MKVARLTETYFGLPETYLRGFYFWCHLAKMSCVLMKYGLFEGFQEEYNIAHQTERRYMLHSAIDNVI